MASDIDPSAISPGLILGLIRRLLVCVPSRHQPAWSGYS
jgi:hypothetical protein